MIDQVMAPLDFEMAQFLHGIWRQRRYALPRGRVSSFSDSGDTVTVYVKERQRIRRGPCDSLIGVRPW
jgi:hypothetical protein